MGKNIKFWLGMMVIVFGIVLVGCPVDSEPTYTVWTDLMSYSEYYDIFGPLNDGYYIRYEFTSAEWNSISSDIPNEGKHTWTEEEIKKWFIGRGFGDTEANKEKAWLMTIDHGFIASRSGSIVYMIIK